MKTALVVLFVAVAVSACARASLPAATPADFARASARWPGVTTDDLEKGRELYRARCSSCHLLIEPGTITASEWPRYIGEMKERAGATPPQVILIERYVVTIASRPSGRSAR